MSIIPVVLSGGSGTRLWPVSRRTKPKQFMALGAPRSLLQQTILRCRDEAVFSQTPIVVGSLDHRFFISEALEELELSGQILLEPAPRNSCAAIAAACIHALNGDKDATLLVLAADHHIPDSDNFTKCVALANQDAQAGKLVTFGIEPSFPATGYGYICPGTILKQAKKVEKFVEKPGLEKAKTYIEAGYLWNSGNFLFRADSFCQELQTFEPEIYEAVYKSVMASKIDLDFVKLDEDAFCEAKSISVDHAIMERSNRAAVLPVSYQWSDIGSWSALSDILPKDDHNNAVKGKVQMLESQNNVVFSDNRLTTVLGMKDTIVVTTRDAVLVSSKAEAEGVKNLVNVLIEKGNSEANESLQNFRPWGNYEQLDVGPNYQVKRIVVKPGGVLSLQKHQYRAEHWVVVEGIAEVTVDEKIVSLEANQSIYVPLGSVHRLANRQKEPLTLIEVQTGSYLGEDDIIRLDDAYGRDKKN